MKISIITVTLNSEHTIRDTLNSVLSQSDSNIEHIIVDGGSTDNTLKILEKYPQKNKKVFIKKNFGIYKSINFGIKESKGSHICILNSDDIFHSNKTIYNIKKIISKNKKTEVFLGDVAYFKKFNYYNLNRFYSSQNFKKWQMRLGLMPPHPGSIIKKTTYEKYGTYLEDFKIAGDFELFLRLFIIKNVSFKIIKNIVVRMRSGGISGKNFYSYWVSTFEILKSFKINKLSSNIFFIIMRIPVKINQLFFFDNKKINKEFSIFKILFDKDYYYKNSFKILDNIKNIRSKDNFILSGMNLAFLGYYANNEVFPKKDLFHWPDGIWVKNHINVKKIPGRNLVNDLKLPKGIKNILVLGNISKNSLDFMKDKFKLKVFHKNLPFGSIEKIKKTKIKLKKNTLIFITLPTPKQEKLAYHLASKNDNYKIICIGASIAIASGDERPVPDILRNYEFLWRLRSDFFRRLKRMFETFIYYFKGLLINKIFDKTRFLKID